MAQLAEALRASNTETAEFRAPDGAVVIVQRITGTEEPDSEEAYIVCLRRAGRPEEDQFVAENLLEVLGRLRELDLPSLDPHSAARQPVVGEDAAATGSAARAP